MITELSCHCIAALDLSPGVDYLFYPKTHPPPNLSKLFKQMHSLLFQAGRAKSFSLTDSNKANTKLALHSWKPTYLLIEQRILILSLKSHISQTVRDFDLMPKLRARPKYQLSSVNRFPGVLMLYLVWLRFLSLWTTFGYVQAWWATLNHSQSGNNPNGIKRTKWSRNFMFLGT